MKTLKNLDFPQQYEKESLIIKHISRDYLLNKDF